MTARERPRIVREGSPSLAATVERFLPAQGGVEVQRDRPGKIHDWHSHDVHESLVVLSGEMVLEHVAGGGIHTADADAGSRIELPADTVHRSTAGAGGCVYVIVPEDGRIARTTRYADPLAGTVVD